MRIAPRRFDVAPFLQGRHLDRLDTGPSIRAPDPDVAAGRQALAVGRSERPGSAARERSPLRPIIAAGAGSRSASRGDIKRCVPGPAPTAADVLRPNPRPRVASSGALTRWVSLRAYGVVTSALFGATTSPTTMRARFERFASVSRSRLLARHPGLVFEDHRAGDLHVESVRAVERPCCALLHLHGGGFFMGSAASYRNRAMRLSFRLDVEVFVPEYRLAPEHPYPAALDDAVAAFRHVRALRPGVPLLLAGDSAGGGLALSLLLRLRDLGAPPPAGAILLSPWTDLTASGRSVDQNEGRDLWFTRRHLETWATHYVAGADARAPAVSPVVADLDGLPPLLLLAGEHELLLDDARRVRDAADRAGVEARLLVGPGMQHDWPLTLPWLAESKDAWRAMRRFVEERSAVRLG